MDVIARHSFQTNPLKKCSRLFENAQSNVALKPFSTQTHLIEGTLRLPARFLSVRLRVNLGGTQKRGWSLGRTLTQSMMESFFSTLQAELTDLERFATRQAARTAVFAFFEVFYNRQRLHSSLGYQRAGGASKT